jgi:transcriptional regulator with GAF, ATPase, and Fis domain
MKMDSSINAQVLLDRIKELEKESIQKTRYERINQTLFKISNAVDTSSSLKQLYESIHKALSRIIDTRNFYIALYDEANDSADFPYCVDEVDGQLLPVQNFISTASLTAEVIRTGTPLLLNKVEAMKYRNTSPFPTPACTPSEIWLGAPLQVKGNTIGAIAVQSYTDPGLYDETDKDVLTAVADQVALAIERKISEEKRETLIRELHSALEEVKTLQGILPICSSCKKIRDDSGYWNQIETYIQQHSKAMFSHGLCPSCSDALYGEEDWYKELQAKEAAALGERKTQEKKNRS